MVNNKTLLTPTSVGAYDLCQPLSTFWVDTLNTSWPDFTICFEDSILLPAPCVFIAVCCVFYLPYLWIKAKRNLSLNGLLTVLFTVKLVLCSSILIVLLMEIGLSIIESVSTAIPGVYFLTPCMLMLGMALAIIILSWERKAGIRSSGVLCVFWLLMILAFALKCRTVIYQSFRTRTFWPSTPRIIMFFITFLLVVASTILSFIADASAFPPAQRDQKLCPERFASFLSRITYWWMNGIMLKGYKQPLTEEDFWHLNNQDNCCNLGMRFSQAWSSELSNKMAYNSEVEGITFRTHKPSLLVALSKAFGGTFLFAGALKLLYTLILFINPLLLRLLIDFMNNKQISDWYGYILAVALFLVTIVSTLLQEKHKQKCFICGIKMRSALIWTIFKKALNLSNAARKDSTVGEIVNLMSVDAQQFQSLITQLHDVWSAPLQIAVCVYFLYDIFGASSLAGVGVLLLLLPINIFISLKAKGIQAKQLKLKDDRIQIISELLNGIKTLKMHAWEDIFLDIIKKVRKEELKLIRRAAILYGIAEIAWQASPLLVSLATFAAYSISGRILTVEIAFVGMSFFNLLRFPVGMLPIVLAHIMQISISLKRITNFLLREELDQDSIKKFMPVDKGDLAVSLEEASFKWSNVDDQPTIHKINLTITKGSLVAVVGHVGSGKSSLLAAITGELYRSSGCAYVEGSIAYVSQQPWIENLSFKDNILFGNESDDSFYRKTLRTCALNHDLLLISGADLAEIGEKGINLSGGQKQRLTLARAVYCNKDIYLLDDTLSAVDVNVGNAVFNEVIGPEGILNNKTRILVTHSLNVLPHVDEIFVMKNGEIVEKGRYHELIQCKGEFSEVLQTVTNSEASVAVEEKEVYKGRIGSKLRRSGRSIRNHSIAAIMQTPKQIRSGISQVKSKTKASFRKHLNRERAKTRVIRNEEIKLGQVKLSVYMLYIKSIGWLFGSIIVIFEVFGQSCYAGSNFWLAQWTSTDNATSATNTSLYLGIYALITMLQVACFAVNAFVVASARVKASKDFHFNLARSVANAPISFFNSTPIGRIISRFSQDIDCIDDIVPARFSGFLSMSVSVLTVVIVISISTPLFLIPVVPLSIIYVFTQRFYIATSRQLGRLESKSRSPIYSHFSCNLQGVTTIRSYGVQERVIADCNSKVDANQMAYYPLAATNFWLAVRLEFVAACVVFFASTFAVISRGQLTAGYAAVSVSFALQITNLLNWLVRAANGLEKSVIAAERIKEYSNLTSEESRTTEKKIPPKNWPDKGVIEFCNYCTTYEGNTHLVLRNINFKIESQEKIGIAGRSGAGKSTLVHALFRLTQAIKGRILIDGLDISTVALHELRSKLTVIPQDPVLFVGTLRLNIDPLGLHTDAEVWNVINTVQLGPLVSKLSNGLDSSVSEGGDNLSVGQRQLICLARALLKNTKVLVLDEATAAIDTETDHLLQKLIREHFRNSTVITVAHRLNTLLDSSRVLILDNGLISEFDRPMALIADENSNYYQMLKEADLLPDVTKF